MPRRNRNSLFRQRKITNIVTLANVSTATQVPEGMPWYVRGEADGKDTYDFSITGFDYALSSTGFTIKYAGVANGATVRLTDFKQYVNVSVAPAAYGQYGLTITPGTGVVLSYYYLR